MKNSYIFETVVVFSLLETIDHEKPTRIDQFKKVSITETDIKTLSVKTKPKYFDVLTKEFTSDTEGEKVDIPFIDMDVFGDIFTKIGIVYNYNFFPEETPHNFNLSGKGKNTFLAGDFF